MVCCGLTLVSVDWVEGFIITVRIKRRRLFILVFSKRVLMMKDYVKYVILNAVLDINFNECMSSGLQ